MKDQFVSNKKSAMDFFRFDREGKILEHWDVIKELPEMYLNGNLMY